MNKNHKNTIIYLAAMVVALLLGACSDDMFEEGDNSTAMTVYSSLATSNNWR